MLQSGKYIVDSFQTIPVKRGRTPVVANQRFKHLDLFRGAFIVLQRSLIKPSQLDYIEAKTKQIESYQIV